MKILKKTLTLLYQKMDRERTHRNEKEIQFLKENYQGGVEYCVLKLRRTKNAIIIKSGRLKISLLPEIKRKNYSKATQKRWNNPKIREKMKKGMKKAWIKRERTKSGTRMWKNSYSFIKCPNHPNSINKNGWVREHVKVMSDFLGRPIKNKEIIHHIDFDKYNNNINNLYLCNNKQNHGKIHNSLNILIKDMFKKKIVIFRDGKYQINKNIELDLNKINNT